MNGFGMVKPMKYNRLKRLVLISMNLTLICAIVCIVNVFKLNFSNVILSLVICYLLYVNTVTLKRITSIIKEKEKDDGKPGTYLG